MSKEEPSLVNETPPPTPASLPAAAASGSPADSGQPTTNPPPKPDAAATPLPPTTQKKQLPPEPELVTIPSYSRWFDWNSIHECEARLLPEFFDDTSSKNPTLYKYYRNSIIYRYRRAASATSSGGGAGKKIGFTEVRKTIVGDVGSIRRVFDFLESWGLINYSPSSSSSAHPHPSNSSSAAKPTPPPPPSQQQQPSPADAAGLTAESGSSNAKKMCSGCKSLCSIACFACEKFGLILCARCYVRGNYRIGLTSSDFKRVEISETAKTDWSDKETLHLLEGLMQYGDDWMRVAEHVGGSRTEKECIARFIKLPFGEQYAGGASGQAEGEEDANLPVANGRGDGGGDDTPPNPNVSAEPSAKRARLTPLADASNPVMAQAAFLSALAGVEAAEAAASAAVTALLGSDSQRTGAANGQRPEFVGGDGGEAPLAEVAASGGTLALPSQEEAKVGAESLLKEEEDTERIISNIAHVQMKEIQDKIVLYEAMDLKLEKEWQLLYQMKNQLFLDQLTLLFNKKHLVATSTKSSEIAAAEPDRTH